VSESASPREVFDQLLEGVTHRRWQERPAQYAEDTAVDHPFRLAGPSRLHGREEDREHTEFDYHGRVTTTGRELTVANIHVLTVRGGQIVVSRDDTNHHVFAEAFGFGSRMAVRAISSTPTDGEPGARLEELAAQRTP